MAGNPASDYDPSYEWKAVVLLSLGFGLVGLDRYLSEYHELAPVEVLS